MVGDFHEGFIFVFFTNQYPFTKIIGASLSEPHTSGTSLRSYVCIYTTDRLTVLAAIYRNF